MIRKNEGRVSKSWMTTPLLYTTMNGQILSILEMTKLLKEIYINADPQELLNRMKRFKESLHLQNIKIPLKKRKSTVKVSDEEQLKALLLMSMLHVRFCPRAKLTPEWTHFGIRLSCFEWLPITDEMELTLA